MFVKVKPGLSHAQYTAGEVFDASPAEMESFGDKFDPVENYVPPESKEAPIPADAKIGDDIIVEAIIEPVAFDVTTAPLATLAQAFESLPAINATDAAINLAAGNSIDLAGVAGTGKDDRITTADVRKALDGNP